MQPALTMPVAESRSWCPLSVLLIDPHQYSRHVWRSTQKSVLTTRRVINIRIGVTRLYRKLLNYRLIHSWPVTVHSSPNMLWCQFGAGMSNPPFASHSWIAIRPSSCKSLSAWSICLSPVRRTPMAKRMQATPLRTVCVNRISCLAEILS